MTCPASFTQNAFRGRNDDGNETTATWKAAQNGNWMQAVDTNFRVRFQMQEGAGCAGNNKVWRLQYNLDGAGWIDCSASSLVVRASASPNLADAANLTDQLTGGTGTFQGSTGFDEVDCNAGGAAMDVAASGHAEAEFCVQIRSADVVDKRTVQLRVTDAGTAIASYTQTPTITIGRLTADAGAFNLTGSDEGLLYKKAVTAGEGAYTFTGSDVTLSKVANKILTADPGAFNLSGDTAGLLLSRLVTAAEGAFTLTGSSVTLAKAMVVTAGAGSYTLTGSDVGLYLNRVVSASAGAYNLTGSDEGLYLARVVTAGEGAYALTGSDVTLTYTQAGGAFTLTADPGNFSITGSDVTLTYVPVSAPAAVQQQGGSSKRKKRKKPRYWWEEDEPQKTVYTEEELEDEAVPVVPPVFEMPSIRIPDLPRPQVDIGPMMKAIRKRGKMKLAAMIAMQMLDD